MHSGSGTVGRSLAMQSPLLKGRLLTSNRERHVQGHDFVFRPELVQKALYPFDVTVLTHAIV